MSDFDMEATETRHTDNENADAVDVAATEEVPKKIEPTESEVTANGDLNILPTTKDEPKEEKMDDSSVKSENQQADKNYEETEAYKMFMTKNLNKTVANNLIRMFDSLELTTEEFDDRAVEMLATFPVDQGSYIVRELLNSKLYGVQNKPQYLMSVMRNFRDRLRSMGAQQAMELSLIPGPDPDKMKELIDRTNYQLEVTVGQRKYHSPPGYEGSDPNQTGGGGCIYIGQIPKDIYEDALIPLFEQVGMIYDLRIMMDPVMGKSRGYGFLIYCEKACATKAAQKYDGYEIQPAKPLKVNVSVANRRLFLGNIPKSKSKDEILEELRKHTENVEEVIIYSNPDAHDGRKNRGFCFVDFSDHKHASDAKRRISMGKIRPWNTDLVVDWAEQQDEPDEETMSQVKVLYVRNLKEAVTEQKLRELFEPHGEVEKIKRIKDYAFIHYKERDAAVQAMKALNHTPIEEVAIEISLAKPQGDQNQKKKLAMKRFGQQPTYGAATPGLGGRGGRGGGGFGPGSSRGRGAVQPPRGGAYPAYPTYHHPPLAGAYGHAPPYDPYYGNYGGGGYGPGYEMYGGYPPMDPYYAQPAAPPYGGPPMRGGPSGYGFGGGTVPRGRGGKASGSGGRGGGKRGGPGGGRGGSKRAGGDFGGPASKRGGRGEDFSSDVPMNMF